MAEDYNYHFLIISPGMQSAWFFQAARRFWQRFQPIVSDNWEILSYIPEELSVAVTVLARPDAAGFVQQQIESQRANLKVDMVVVGDLAMMESILNARANEGLPFG